MKQLKKCICTLLMLLVLSCGSTMILSCTTLPMTAEAAAIKINKGEVTLAKGKIYQLKAPGTKKKITWKSNKPTIVSVNSKGTIAAKNLGRATITAKVANKKYIYKVTVRTPGIADAYEGLVRKYGNKDGSYFGCYDFDSDGIKEILIVKTDYSKFGVFDYVNNKIVAMGSGVPYNTFSISRDGKYLIVSNADLIHLYSIINGRIRSSVEYAYPAASDENSEEYKEWYHAYDEFINKSISIPAKYYSSVDAAVNVLYKMFNR